MRGCSKQVISQEGPVGSSGAPQVTGTDQLAKIAKIIRYKWLLQMPTNACSTRPAMRHTALCPGLQLINTIAPRQDHSNLNFSERPLNHAAAAFCLNALGKHPHVPSFSRMPSAGNCNQSMRTWHMQESIHSHPKGQAKTSFYDLLVLQPAIAGRNR